MSNEPSDPLAQRPERVAQSEAGLGGIDDGRRVLALAAQTMVHPEQRAGDLLGRSGENGEQRDHEAQRVLEIADAKAERGGSAR